jgi:hypothetical protein
LHVPQCPCCCRGVCTMPCTLSTWLHCSVGSTL